MPKWGRFLIFVFLKKYRLRYHEEECPFPRSLWHGTQNSWVEMGDVKTKKKGLGGWGRGGRRMFPNKLHSTA